eukprot:gene12458-14723_t
MSVVYDDFFVFVGTYTTPQGHCPTARGEGILVYELDISTGRLLEVSKNTQIVNPSFVKISADARHLYAVSEIEEYDGEKMGCVSSYEVGEDGDLKFLNRVPATGGTSCFLDIDDDKTCLLVFEGSGPNKARQESSHPHSAVFSHSGNFVYVPDLGTDKVHQLQLNSKTCALKRSVTTPFVQLAPGSGPRHLTFHPFLPFAYCINELDSTIQCFRIGKDQELSPTRTYSALPKEYAGTSTCADIHIHPNGQFLYGSNRGHDSIALFMIDAESGELSWVDYFLSGGKTPRNFAIDPTGTILLVANQDSDDICTFFIDRYTGHLTKSLWEVKLSAPVSLQIVHKPILADCRFTSSGFWRFLS